MLKSLLKSVHPFFFTLQSFKLPSTRIITILGLLFLTILSVSSTCFYFYILKDMPATSSLTTQPLPQTTHIRDRHGVELYKIYSYQNRTLVKLADIPLSLRQAAIAVEDKNFYSHSGFSPQSILRAVVHDLQLIIHNHSDISHLNSQFVFEGGSTITQQLVKTSLLSPEQTLRRKLRELILSLAVEAKYSKDQILEMYLNRVSFGGSAYGVEEAAQTYFGKSVRDLDLAQSSLLAGLPAAPTTYSPFGAHPELAKSRQQEVLNQMVSTGFITWDQAASAAAENIALRPPQADIKAPHFVMYVKELLSQKYGSAAVEQGGLDVTTSLDLATQDLAESAVAEETAKIAYLHVTNGAGLVTSPRTGEILAMVGSRDYFDLKNNGNVNVVLSPRQPGSSIKPVNYALAFSRGFTPASIIEDSPITYATAGQPSYSPVNYDSRYHGQVTLRTALASSYNIPAVKLLAANGVANMVSLGQRLGITTWTDPSRFGLSLTLGGGEVTLLDMSVVYGVFANSGIRVDLQPILSVRDSTGRELEKYRPDSLSFPSVLDPKIAFLISDILSDNTARSPTFGLSSDLNIPHFQVAVKTGTTNNLRDNWTIGYTPDLLVAVWVGNNDNSPMSYIASGVTGASPIWHRVMTSLLAARPSTAFSAPADLVKVSVCPYTNMLACSSCPGRPEYFLPGTEPKNTCTDDLVKHINTDKILTGYSTN